MVSVFIDYLQKIFGNYYGIDFFAMIMSLLFVYYIGNKNKYGFVFYVIGNMAWMAVNTMAHIWPGVFLNIVLIFLNIRAYIKWKKHEHEQEMVL